MSDHFLSGLTANTFLLSHLANPHLYMVEAGPLIGLNAWMITQELIPGICLSLALLHGSFKCGPYLALFYTDSGDGAQGIRQADNPT